MEQKTGGISPLDDLSQYRFRYSWMGAIIGAALLLLAGAVSMPLFFESPSMWYKFGLAKAQLQAGKMFGLAAATLLFFQLLLAGRLKLLDRIFSLPGLVRIHQLNARVILLLAVLHPILVLTSGQKLLIPLELRYWPEWVGVGLSALILIQFSLSQWRIAFRIKYHRWLLWHRCVGGFILCLVIVHILSVSETFEDEGFPRTVVLAATALFAVFWLWIRSGWLMARRMPFAVTRVTAEGKNTVCIEMRPKTSRPFRYFPGQFVIFSFHSRHVPREPHPFTLSSTPTRPQSLQITVRASGDWTRHIGRITPGDRVFIQGPFGRFSHVLTDTDREIVMIAGGIGITPMLSMLRYMSDRQDHRAITLIWSNRTRDEMVYSQDLDDMTAKLTGLRPLLNFTRKEEADCPFGRLNAESLKEMLSECSRQAAVFLCGPSRMMRQLRADLKKNGFSAGSVFTETFGL